MKKSEVESVGRDFGNFWTTINDDERARQELVRFYKNKQQRLEETHRRRIEEIEELIVSLNHSQKTSK